MPAEPCEEIIRFTFGLGVNGSMPAIEEICVTEACGITGSTAGGVANFNTTKTANSTRWKAMDIPIAQIFTFELSTLKLIDDPHFRMDRREEFIHLYYIAVVEAYAAP